MKFRITPLILAAAVAPLWAAPPLYSIIQLPPLGQQLNTAGINGHGDIVGNVNYTDRYYSAFLYRKSTGVIRDIGSGSAPSTATSINLSGQIVGEDQSYATLWNPAGRESMLPGSSIASQANGINPEGLIVGQSSFNAAFWKNNTLTVIPDTGLESSAAGVGPMGHIVGWMDIAGNLQAFLYFNGTTRSLGMLPGGTFSEAFAVNSWGETVGESGTGASSYTSHAFLYSHGALKDLGTLANDPLRSSSALGINDHDEIVGYSDVYLTAGGVTNRAFIYVDGAMYNLTFWLDKTSPIAAYTRLRAATAINCNGWIAADGYDARDPNTPHSYLLIPKRPLRPDCPVP